MFKGKKSIEQLFMEFVGVPFKNSVNEKEEKVSSPAKGLYAYIHAYSNGIFKNLLLKLIEMDKKLDLLLPKVEVKETQTSTDVPVAIGNEEQKAAIREILQEDKEQKSIPDESVVQPRMPDETEAIGEMGVVGEEKPN